MSDKIRELLNRIVPRLDAGGPNPIDPELHHCEWVLYRERERIHAEFAAVLAQQPAPVNRLVIRDVFLRNGFTIKEGQTDLKPYVYAAAEELLSLDGKAVAAAPAAPAPVAQEPVQMHHEPHNRAMWHENCPGRRFSSPMKPRGDGSWECVVCGTEGRVTAPPSAEQPDAVNVSRDLLVDALLKEALNLCDAVESVNDLPPVKYALQAGRAVNKVRDSAALLAGGDKP